MRPVEVVGDEGHLLDRAVEGVAEIPPGRSTSSSNACRHCGQLTRHDAPSDAVDLVVEVLQVREVGGEQALDRPSG